MNITIFQQSMAQIDPNISVLGFALGVINNRFSELEQKSDFLASRLRQEPVPRARSWPLHPLSHAQRTIADILNEKFKTHAAASYYACHALSVVQALPSGSQTHGVQKTVGSVLCKTTTTVHVRQSTSGSARMVGRRFAPVPRPQRPVTCGLHRQ